MFLQLIDTHYPAANKLNKTFNSNTVEISDNCTQNISKFMKGHKESYTDKETPSVRV